MKASGLTRVLFSCFFLVDLSEGQNRVVVLGVDGMDHAVTSELIAAGRLPNLKALGERGAFRPLRPTNPAQSPVSWASLTTGLNPGGHGILGFVRRRIDNGEVIKDFGLVEAREHVVLSRPSRVLLHLLPLAIAMILHRVLRRRRGGLLVAVGVLAFLLLVLRYFLGQVPVSIGAPANLRQGTAFFESLDHEGIACTSLFAPCAFPAPKLERGRLLSGLGTPDAAGTPGAFALFDDEPVPSELRETSMGGRIFPLRKDSSDTWRGASLVGPKSPLGKKALSIDLDVRARGSGVRLSMPGRDVDLELSRYSGFEPVRFPVGDLGRLLPGLVRFRLLRGPPHPAIYQEPVQFDPRDQLPWAPVTSPISFGKELAQGGLFETLGWATATNPYQDEVIDDAAILDDVAGLVERQHAMIRSELKKKDWRVHFSVLSTPDRLQHVFWRDRDSGHPAHDPEAARRRGDVIGKSYEEVDVLVGWILSEVLAPGDTLLVVSDHGFQSFRHAVNVNRWLAAEGYLVARSEGRKLLNRDLGTPVKNVDWEKTRAYSLGLGRIWLNLKGREPGGIVDRKDAAALEVEIRDRMIAFRHEGRPVVRSVARESEIYRGEALAESADLIVGFEAGYRVSWDSCLLGMDEPMVFENRSRWSGDHCSVDPDLVPGVIFATCPLLDRAAGVVDIVSTLRVLLGLPQVTSDGHSLVEAGR